MSWIHSSIHVKINQSQVNFIYCIQKQFNEIYRNGEHLVFMYFINSKSEMSGRINLKNVLHMRSFLKTAELQE